MQVDSHTRRLWFGFLQRVALPPGMRLLRLWLRTCRCTLDGEAEAGRCLDGSHPVLVAVLHSSMIHMLALAMALRATQRRSLFVLLSASLDGRLLAAALRRFGMDHAFGAAGEEGGRGALEVIRRVREGQVAVIAVDGPTGPAGVVKAGLQRLARAAGADILTVRTSSRGFAFPSWDRCRVPWPYSTVHVTMRRLSVSPTASASDLHQHVERLLAGRDGVPRVVDVSVAMPSNDDGSRTTAPDGAR